MRNFYHVFLKKNYHAQTCVMVAKQHNLLQAVQLLQVHQTLPQAELQNMDKFNGHYKKGPQVSPSDTAPSVYICLPDITTCIGPDLGDILLTLSH